MYYMNEICNNEGCTRPVAIRKIGKCLSHAQVQYRKKKTEKCSLEWCDNIVYSRNLCPNHYHRTINGLPIIDPRAPKPRKPDCAFESCDRESRTNGLCGTHNLQDYLGKELTPIRAWNTKTEGEMRKCRTCEEWKVMAEGFYMRSDKKGYQGECKVCATERNRRNTLKRRGVLVE